MNKLNQESNRLAGDNLSSESMVDAAYFTYLLAQVTITAHSSYNLVINFFIGCVNW